MKVKINATLPFDWAEEGGDLLTMEAVAEVAQTLERAGFDGCCVTDHPCPTGRWLDNGGHNAQDPFVMLSLVAAATKTLRLQTGILVLPYRNPFIVARSVASLDLFSNGRVSLGMGAGYLKGEYRALGVDFDRRNELMDEYLRALKAAWGADEFTFEGTGYQAFGNRIQPRPVQRPNPPLLVGGNSRRAIRRAVELGDAWNPFFNSALVSATTRTANIGNDEDLAEGIRYLREQSEAMGRADPPQIILGSLTHPGDSWNPEALLERIGKLAGMGVVGAAAHIDARGRAEYCDMAERFGTEVIARI